MEAGSLRMLPGMKDYGGIAVHLDEPLTRKLENQRLQLEKKFSHFFTIDDFEAQLNALEKNWNRSVRPQLLSDLYAMFAQLDISFEKGRELAYYRDLAAAADIPTLGVVEQRMMDTLLRIFREYPAPAAYLARTIRRLSDEEIAEEEPLRLTILRRFIRHGGWLQAAGYRGRLHIRKYAEKRTGRKLQDAEVADHLDDKVFDVLKDAQPEQKKAEAKYGLLKLADDLGKGLFRTQGSTKRGLYLLALAYDMKYYPDPETADNDRDVDRQLFRNYYTNNLIRFLSEDYRRRSGDFETDPDGHGINYKNFAEMIYLYYLAGDAPPEQKIAGASAMIERVRAKAAGMHRQAESPDERPNTLEYELMTRYAGVFDYTEDDFERYILENYECSTLIEDGSPHPRHIGIMSVEDDQRRAIRQFRQIIAQLKEALRREASTLEDCSYGLWLVDPERLSAKDSKDASDLLVILQRMNELILNGEELARRAERGTVTRASMLGAYYYLYTTLREADMSRGRRSWQSFRALFEDFKTEADKHLSAAGYQLIDSRNLFDLLMTFALYARLNT